IGESTDVQLQLKRANIRGTVVAGETRTALIIGKTRKVVARIDGRAARKQGMRKDRAAVVLERAEHGIGIGQVGAVGQSAAGVVAAEIVTGRINCAPAVHDCPSKRASVQDAAADQHGRGAHTGVRVEKKTTIGGGIASESAVKDLNVGVRRASWRRWSYRTTIVNGASRDRRVAAERAVGNPNQGVAWISTARPSRAVNGAASSGHIPIESAAHDFHDATTSAD